MMFPSRCTMLSAVSALCAEYLRMLHATREARGQVLLGELFMNQTERRGKNEKFRDFLRIVVRKYRQMRAGDKHAERHCLEKFTAQTNDTRSANDVRNDILRPEL